MNTFFLLLLLICIFPLGYLYLLALASIPNKKYQVKNENTTFLNFAIAIPAHDEETVIEKTLSQLIKLEYPRDRFSIHVVADHCTDNTAQLVRMAGGNAHERNDGPRTGKSEALSWLFGQIFEMIEPDAVVIFDADTLVAPDFLSIINSRIIQGSLVVQGQHIISNHNKGWFPALTWAMFMIDNRIQNLGRSNLDWSAKHMGDSICFRSEILRKFGWGKGLTEDYQMRQRLLLDDIKIDYEPRAKGYGEAPTTWHQARIQRARWLRGTSDASKQYARSLLIKGLKRLDGALLDGGLQAYLPSYSTLTILSLSLLFLLIIFNWIFPSIISPSAFFLWFGYLILLIIYPLLGLVLERAPLKAYIVILSGPLFILWRTWIAFKARFISKSVPWIRTARG